MNNQKQVVRCDYSKFASKPSWRDPTLQLLEFWGLYEIDDRIQIDVVRYITACKSVGLTEFIPEQLPNKEDNFFLPKRIHRHDYAINIFNDLINQFASDWELEFKPILGKIKTPKDVYNETRCHELMFTSCADDIDDIETNAWLKSYNRQLKYNQIIQSLYCQFIMKLATEVDRFTQLALKTVGYNDIDFSFNRFLDFIKTIQRNNNEYVELKDLKGFNAYNMLHKINNFLKHNTISAYQDLELHFPNNVKSIKNNTARCKYENGMFAGDWIIIKENYIDNLIKKLRVFFEQFCSLILKEDINDAKWNYDDYFIDAFHNLKDIESYLGV